MPGFHHELLVVSAIPDDTHMDRALALAAQGRGRTSPNPMVGAVVVTADGIVVGEGFHARAGGDHAEIRALAAAGPAARGSTLYCTLEPCCHHGRTSPCAPRIVAAGVERVVVAMVDPHPRVRGGGLAYLRAHGVRVDVGMRQAAAEQINEAFVIWVALGRPFVTMKIATSLDGRIAARPGTRTPVTAEPAVRAVHAQRAVVDAVGVGSTTLLVDDPLLTVRGVARAGPLTRVVFDRRLRTPPTARIFGTLSTGPVVIVTTERAASARPGDVSRLAAAGADVEALVRGDVCEALQRLGARQITTLVVEGGTTIHRAAWTAGVVDRVQLFIAQSNIGEDGVGWLAGHGLSLADLKALRVRVLGPDLQVEGDVYRDH